MKRLILSGLPVMLAFAVAAPTLAAGKIADSTDACNSIPAPSTTGGGSRERTQAIGLCNQEILIKQQQAIMSQMDTMMMQMKAMQAQMNMMTGTPSGMSKLAKPN